MYHPAYLLLAMRELLPPWLPTRRFSAFWHTPQKHENPAICRAFAK